MSLVQYFVIAMYIMCCISSSVVSSLGKIVLLNGKIASKRKTYVKLGKTAKKKKMITNRKFKVRVENRLVPSCARPNILIRFYSPPAQHLAG